jgi:hypothetical protein
VLTVAGLKARSKLGKGFDLEKDTPELVAALKEADRLLDLASEREPKVSREGSRTYDMQHFEHYVVCTLFRYTCNRN